MELFINQGKDSTIEPGYLAETKQAISEPVLISKTITENDTYNAVDDSADGYSSVTVNVPTGAEVFEVAISGEAYLGEDVETGDIEGQVSNISINKTYTQIMSAINDGKFVKVIYTDTIDSTKSHICQYWLFAPDDLDETWIMIPILSGVRQNVLYVIIEPDNTIHNDYIVEYFNLPE